MARFVVGTCGVLAEAAAFDVAAPAWTIGFMVLGLLAAIIIWWIDAQVLIDRLIGLNLS